MKTSLHPAAAINGKAPAQIFLLGVALLAALCPWASRGAPAEFGRELQIGARLGTGPAMDVATAANRAYVIGRGSLRIVDITTPTAPRVLGKIDGLGNTRQVAVADGIAYVSAREDGLFVVDVADPAAPRLLCHYDSVEWATGVAISGKVLFIALRQFGVELVDVSRPAEPEHLGTIRTGEAQSVVARNGWLYTGVWGSSEVVVADVRNARSPVITAKVPLDGFGDGVDIKGTYLYVATGHHSRAAHRESSDPGFGRGHGLEIFDVSDPAKPKFVSRVKFPQLYALGNDWWAVTVAGDYAFVADTHNGIFVVDVRDPRQPRCVAHRRLPPTADGKPADSVGGLAPVKDHLLVAGSQTDLFVLDAPGLGLEPQPEPSVAPTIGPRPSLPENGVRIYRPGGQVYAAALCGDKAVVACGAAGLKLLELTPSFRELGSQSTTDVATDVCVLGNTVYCAGGTDGLSIWTGGAEGKLRFEGRYRVNGARVRHVAVPAPGRYALVQVGSQQLHIVDVSVPSSPKLVLQDTHLGLLYGSQVLEGLVQGRYSAAFWHVTGLHWYDLYGGAKPVYVGQRQPERFGVLDGITVLTDRILAIRSGGIVLVAPNEAKPLAQLPRATIPGHPLEGKPSLDGNRLFVSNRATGVVRLVDIANPAKPTLQRTLVTRGNPGRVVPLPGGFMIPDGYNGLLLYSTGAAAGASPSTGAPAVEIAKGEAEPLLEASPRLLRLVFSRDGIEGRSYHRELALQAALELAQTTGDRTCRDRVLASVTALGIGRGVPVPWAWTPELDVPRTPNYQSELFGSLTHALYRATGDQGWVTAFASETERVRRESPRSPEGAAMAPRGELPGTGATLLIDAMQEYVARMARAGALTSERGYFEEALRQYQACRSVLRNPETGLWSQGRGWLADRPNALSPGAWSRGHGWLMRGLIGTLEALPKQSEEFSRFRDYLQELADTMLPLQQPDGTWHTLLHRAPSESPADISGTAMVATGLSRGWREGWLKGSKHLEAARRAFAVLPAYVSEKGEVRSVSPGPGPLVSEDRYLVKEFPRHNAHGVFAVLFAAAEAATLARQTGHEPAPPALRSR